MAILKPRPIPCSLSVLSLLMVIVLTTICSFVRPFGIRNRVKYRPLQKSPLRTSMWDVDIAPNLEGDDDKKVKSSSWEADLMSHLENHNEEVKSHLNTTKSLQNEQANQIEIIKYDQEEMKSKPAWCPFNFYLYQLKDSIRDRRTKVLHMDDELKRMESKYYFLAGNDLPEINFPLGNLFEYYSGNIVEPKDRTYELILRAYSKAKLGEDGFKRAENIIERYEKLKAPQRATSKMMTFVMKACIAAGNLERTEYWLKRIEERYEITNLLSDFPSHHVYNPFVAGLKNMKDISDRKKAKRSMEILSKIRPPESMEKYKLASKRQVYLNIMKYQELGYNGSAAFLRVEKVFRELQKNYRSTENFSKLKPTAEALTPVFKAASKYYVPHDQTAVVVEKANALFDEFDQLYKETNDTDFCPNREICFSLVSIYARMNRQKVNLVDFEERTTLLLERMEDYKVEFLNPRLKTAALNRVLVAAEIQLPKIPMSDPLKTREVFVTALNTFKKFHDIDARVKVSPNASTYQIFLKACGKLPEGDTRFKLAAKAFQLCQSNDFVTIDTILELHKANPEHAISVLNSTNYLGFKKENFPPELRLDD